MKRIIIFLLLFNNLFVFGQNDYNFIIETDSSIKQYRKLVYDNIPMQFIQKKIDWKQYEINVSPAVKKDYIKRLTGNIFFPKPYDLIFLNEYHLIDFNGDGKLDVIYSGRNPIGGEKDNFAFFENQNDSLRLILKLLGNIIEISRESESNPIKFVVWEQPCCAELINKISYYEYYKNNDIVYCENKEIENYSESYGIYIKNYYPNFYSINEYAYIRNTFLPDKIVKNDSNKTIEKFKTSIIQTNPYFEISDDYRKTYSNKNFNLKIGLLKNDVKYEILNQIEINNKTYYFICFSIFDIEINPNICKEMNCKNNQKLCGWIE